MFSKCKDFSPGYLALSILFLCRVCPLCRGDVCRSEVSGTNKMSWRVNSCVVHAFLWNVSMQIISHVTCRFPAPCRNQSSEVFYEWGMQPPLVLFALSSGSLILFSWVKSTQGWNAYSVSCTQIKSDTYICKGSSKFVFCFYSLAKIETWFLFFFFFPFFTSQTHTYLFCNLPKLSSYRKFSISHKLERSMLFESRVIHNLILVYCRKSLFI